MCVFGAFGPGEGVLWDSSGTHLRRSFDGREGFLGIWKIWLEDMGK